MNSIENNEIHKKNKIKSIQTCYNALQLCKSMIMYENLLKNIENNSLKSHTINEYQWKPCKSMNINYNKNNNNYQWQSITFIKKQFEI